MDCVVVSDAWLTASDHDLKYHPTINKLNSAFGVYLNSRLVCLRDSYHIYHDASGYPIMESVESHRDIVVNGVLDIPDEYDNYYICGFHLGRCTHRKASVLAKHRANVHIVRNLCMLYPSDTIHKLDECESFPMVNHSPVKGFYYVK